MTEDEFNEQISSLNIYEQLDIVSAAQDIVSILLLAPDR